MTVRAHKKPGRQPCSVDGCAEPMYARTWCVMHYSRWRKRGAVGTAERQRERLGSGHINPWGYRIIKQETHPLARAQGKLAEHRAVLFAAIGDGAHACHWCGVFPLHWTAPRQSLRIQVDHLDHDRLNNVATNLVPSCLDCNTKRHAEAS